MSFAREARCVFCTFTRSARPTRASIRNFATTPKRTAWKPSDDFDRHPKIKLDKAEEISEADLQKHYSPEQQAAIRAANKVIKPEHLEQTPQDNNPWSMNYYDDLTTIDPAIDKPVKAPWTNVDENVRLKTDDELDKDLYKFMQTMPEDEEAAVKAWRNFDDNLRITVGSEGPEMNPRTALAPDLPKMDDGKKKQKKVQRDAEGEPRKPEQEPSPALLRLMQMTGYSQKQISQIYLKNLVIHSVTNQTRLGKIRRQYCLSIAGNGNGMIGIGEGKSEEALEAFTQSNYRAIRNMQPIMRYENRTIFGDVSAKVSATELELYARPPGFGLRCQRYIFEICKAAGISDLAARVTRSRNPMNTVKAAVQALQSQKNPEDIARARGKKLVDVRKVYYANQI